jgi:hypothetical protein
MLNKWLPTAVSLIVAVLTLVLFNSTEETFRNLVANLKKVARAPAVFQQNLRNPEAGNSNFPGDSFAIQGLIRSQSVLHYRLSEKLATDPWGPPITSVLVWPVKTEARSQNVFMAEGEILPLGCVAIEKKRGVTLARCP